MGKSLRYNEKYFIFAAKWQLKKTRSRNPVICDRWRDSSLFMWANEFYEHRIELFCIYIRHLFEIYLQTIKNIYYFCSVFLKFSDHE